ncbi:XRE family transcriptional regulator [Shewanella sp. OPT22]|nr:XRE family transcriptional regulator [Shewanella sp. OPT22]
MTLGQIIKSFRTGVGLSQPEFAEKVGIEQSYLSKLENDKSLPSNEVIQSLLVALELTLEQLLSKIELEQEQQRLQQIPLIAEYFQKQKQHQIFTLRRYMYASSLLIVLGICSFYAGYTKTLFNENLYIYQSKGVNLVGEPDDIFQSWRHLTNKSNVDKKRQEMNERYDPKNIETQSFKGQSFIVPETAGNRYYWLDTRRPVPRLINTWLKIIGIFLFCSGIMGFVLERRLFRKVF